MGQAPLRDEARQPGEQAQVHRDHGRLGPGGRRRRGLDGRARLQRQVLLLPGLAPPRALDRRAGRHQRREELPQRRRQHSAPLLRHDQGRRLPGARVQRLPARPGLGRHHRPVRRARACPSRASTADSSTTAPSAGRRSRGPSTPAARRASSSCSAPTRRSSARSAWARSRCTRATRCWSSSSSTAARAASSCATWSPGEIQTHMADAVCLATGGYGNVFYLATYAKGCNGTAIWRAYKKGAAFANPCFTQIHPTCIPVTGEYQSKLTLMSESLRNDGRIWVPKGKADKRPPGEIPEEERDYYLERMYPSFGNLAPRDISSRAAKKVCDEGRGVGPDGIRRVPRLQGRDRPPRQEHDRGEIRQPLRDVRAHHRREPVRGSDADLPRQPLHDGRPVGGLQPDVARSRGSSSSARRTSPTTGPTASAPPR